MLNIFSKTSALLQLHIWCNYFADSTDVNALFTVITTTTTLLVEAVTITTSVNTYLIDGTYLWQHRF